MHPLHDGTEVDRYLSGVHAVIGGPSGPVCGLGTCSQCLGRAAAVIDTRSADLLKFDNGNVAASARQVAGYPRAGLTGAYDDRIKSFHGVQPSLAPPFTSVPSVPSHWLPVLMLQAVNNWHEERSRKLCAWTYHRRNLRHMEPVRIGLGILALLILVGLSILILIGYRRAARRADGVIRVVSFHRVEHPLEDRLEHRRNVRALKNQHGIPIERLGADLRRLRQLIQHSEHHSATQQVALRQAYDSVLSETCRMLSIEHELELPTAGMERDIERLRIEAELEAHGIVLSRPRRHDQNA
jgi:hypothetical protein